MRKFFLLIVSLLVSLGIVSYFLINKEQIHLLSPLGLQKSASHPLLKYSFENLKKKVFKANPIILSHEVNKTDQYTSQIFYYFNDRDFSNGNQSKVSGLVNVPNQPGTYPVIVMFRGYVPKDIYKSGVGTQPAAEYFVSHGFITLAPDFLGFGDSDNPSKDGFEERFQTYTSALSLLSSLKNLNSALQASYSGTIKADLSKVGIWGHSNGGHIALSVLAISGSTYPTVLWAPVSKSFPYSILYYTDEYNDQGKSLRKAVAGFENDYNTDIFSPTNYYKWIKAPIEIHQGQLDQEVPLWWSDALVDTLNKMNLDVTYFTYPNSDHNLLPMGWTNAVERSIEYYVKYFK